MMGRALGGEGRTRDSNICHRVSIGRSLARWIHGGHIPRDRSTCFLASLDESRTGFDGCEQGALKIGKNTVITFHRHLLAICSVLLAYIRPLWHLEMDVNAPMVSSTSAARGVVVAKGRALGSRSDRAAARKSCGRMIEREWMRGGVGR